MWMEKKTKKKTKYLKIIQEPTSIEGNRNSRNLGADPLRICVPLTR